ADHKADGASEPCSGCMESGVLGSSSTTAAG
ncbi:hypothetical protein A2U01_0107940, partial [Trifolium medium]|nr:hypothetical protein [Trifolium medium]